ncbi:MAG: hypothetical protein R3C14_16725 [Caldilineaceae bacterium]
MSKIGLLASFEGLHRRDGYYALEAMRLALTELTPATVAVIPLAIDVGDNPAQAQRAAAKLLLDRSLDALIGPYQPEQIQAIQPLLATNDVFWLAPTFINQEQGFTPDIKVWLRALITTVAEEADQQGGERLVLAGWRPAEPTLGKLDWLETMTIPITVADDPAAVHATDAVLWLGAPEDAVAYFTVLRQTQPALPFWLAFQGDSLIFAERATVTGPVYWTIWLDEGYAQWSQQHPSLPPSAYLTYQATKQALKTSVIKQSASTSLSWRAHTFTIKEDGTLEEKR